MGTCIKEMTLDLTDYIAGGTVFKRKAVRGIIRHEDKYLVIHGKYGDNKFPGGGMKDGEDLTDTLLREVQEETGYRVIADSIQDYILVHEKRKGDPDDLLEMDSWYFFCDVEEIVFERNLDEYEQEYDYQVAWLPLHDIIQKNEGVEKHGKIPWIVRETMVMHAVQEIFLHNDGVNFYEEVTDELLKFAVIIAKTNGKYVFCKHKNRNTLEVPGGHRERGENILDTAKRELYEETGAVDYDIKPVCVYSVTAKGHFEGQESFGMLYYAEIRTFEKELHSEIEKIMITDQLPNHWTYPEIQPKLMEEAKKRGFF